MVLTVRWIPAALLLLVTATEAQDTPDGYYLGELRVGAARSALGLAVDGAGVLADLLSQWMLQVPVGKVQRGSDGLELELPGGLGHARLRADGERLVGSLALADGTQGTVELRRTAQPVVRFEETVFTSGELRFAATLGLPEGPGPHPAVILVPGGGDSERGQPATRFLAGFLPRSGIACLVYDKRGSGASQGDWRAVGLGELAEDALAALESLRARSDIDPARIGFFAASQGSWVADLACARQPGRVAFVVHHSGPAVSVLAADTFATRSSARDAGLEERETEELLALWQLECEALREGVPPAEHGPLLDAIRAAAGRPWFARLPYRATPSEDWWVGWYPRVMDFDPRATLEGLDVPMLWLYGACDTQSDVARDVEVLGVLARGGEKPWAVHVFPGGNHGISVPLGNTGAPMTMADGYFETLLGWLERRVDRR